jgi:hypothetical protein
MVPAEKQPSLPNGHGVGFVVAMNARFTIADAPPAREWVIVSRWGSGGDYLSIARTFVAAAEGETAPIQLTPRLTVLALLLRLPPAAARPAFLFAQALPDRVSLAGTFMPAEGYVRLLGRRDTPRLHAEGRCLAQGGHSAWRVDGVRVSWFGEFIEGMQAE